MKMIASTKKLEKYCTDYTKIENYEDALKSPLRYDLHHRLEISEMQSKSDLIFLHLYYNRPPEELVFLEHGEHIRLHKEGKNLSAETKNRMSEAHKGEKNSNFGKHFSAETRQKMSEANKGNHYVLGHHWNLSDETRQKMSNAKKNMSAETRQKISEARKGKHWHLENGKHVYTN